MKKLLPILFAVATSLVTSVAFAEGLESGTVATTNFKNWIYAILAVAAVVYMLVQCFMAWGNKITWMDVLHAAGKVAVTGGAPALVTFAWGIWA
jgi:hypothetical protein